MLSDQEIMTRSRQGQNDLLDVLIDRHGSDLYTFCLRLCRRRADADDLFQDSWLAVLRHGARYDAQKPFRPWLFTVCLNLQRDRFRRARRWLKVLAGHQLESGRAQGMRASAASPEGALAGSEKKELLEAALARLDESLRLPLLLHYYSGMPMNEIADVLRLAVGTVKSRLYRARERLRSLMQEEEDGRP
ncbi:MAG: sigma-70 family RNA polymerase sigma factor [Candidatus Aminicenantes bacterium]|nr:sigma-70 family RNA polymerase sigma factor [Candidatus Aminicenantes bacterium]